MSRTCVFGVCIPSFVLTLAAAIYLLLTYHQSDIEMNTSGKVTNNSECHFSLDDGSADVTGNITVEFWPPNDNTSSMITMIVPADNFCDYETVYTCCSNYLNRVMYFYVETTENGEYQVDYMSTKLTYNNHGREIFGSLFAIGACFSLGSIIGYLIKEWDDKRVSRKFRSSEISSTGIKLNF